MALSISQMVAVSYPAVLADKRKAANQWAESAVLRAMEAGGFIVRRSLGPTIEAPLDYRRNPAAAFLATDLQQTSLTKTEVMTAASFTPAQISAPITWSKMDEVQNPSENQKVALVAGLLDNGIESHDDLIEQYIFATSTNGFLGLLTHIPTSGQGSDGGIDAAIEAWWRPYSALYTDDTDIENAFTTTWNVVSKGSGAKLTPKLMVSDGATNALFESTQQALQRYESQDLKAGFKAIMFKTAQYVFGQYATTSVYFLNPKNFQLVVSKEFFRERGDTVELQAVGAEGYRTSIYSALQSTTNNRSRLGVAHL